MALQTSIARRAACNARASPLGRVQVRHQLGKTPQCSCNGHRASAQCLTPPPSHRLGKCFAGKKKEVMMWEALREATDEEMERDATVCVMGEHAQHFAGLLL